MSEKELAGSILDQSGESNDKFAMRLKITEKLFETLMGKQAELRFQFIQKNANFIKNLDI